VIRVEGLVKRYGEQVALDGVSFSARPGTIVALLGPNGAGKSTAVRCLTTLERPDAGNAVVGGYDVVTEPHSVRSQILVTGQSTTVDEALTGRQNLVMFGELLGLGRRPAKVRAADVLDSLELVDAANRAVKTYSGGMRRRLDLGVSLLVERPVLFLDEPTVGLDPRSRRNIWQRVSELRDRGTTILLTTQTLEEADALADELVVIDDGRVIAAGTPADLKGRVAEIVCTIRVTPGTRPVPLEDALAWVDHIEATETEVKLHLASMDALQRALSVAAELGIAADEVEVRRPSLEEAFLELTDSSARQRA